MKRHMTMHVAMLAAILAIFGLSAVGVAIPSGFVYLVLLACPLMMVLMMSGMGHNHDGIEHGHGSDDGGNPHAHMTGPPRR